jgi:hypothetical protein
MARCPLSEILRDVSQLGDTPPICQEQCGHIWEKAVKDGNYFTDTFDDENESTCSHPSAEVYSQKITRVGNTATRDLVYFDFCTSCGDEVQTTNYAFECPHEEN